VKKERRGLSIVMPKTKVPNWFDYRCEGGIPCLWVRGKFPNVALAMVFQDADEKKRMSLQQFVQLHLVINGQRVPHNGHCYFRIGPDHVLVCDLRFINHDEQWLRVDALLRRHEWNQVQISYEVNDYTYDTDMEGTMTL
ncbi:TMV resistance protein N-like, partial [Trifolium medium]|nr:TMV resistance protein N-like [Trifolium medium]